jgi:hypothetical protein
MDETSSLRIVPDLLEVIGAVLYTHGRINEAIRWYTKALERVIDSI